MGNNRISTGKRYFLLRATEVYRIPLPRLTANQHSSARSHTASPEFHFSGAIPVFRLTMPARGVMFLKSQHPNHISGGDCIMWIGISAGIAAAFFQDCGYVCSRLYVKKQNHTSWNLLLYTQILMGGVSLLLLPFLWDAQALSGAAFILPLLLSAGGSVFGQFFFFRSEKHIEPARISSMMALRVVLLAVISALFLGERYDWMQIAGIILAPLSAFVINWENGRIRLGGMQWLGAALLFYCVSDLSVKYMIDGIHTGNIFHSSLLALCFVNILLGAAALPFMRGKWKLHEITGTVPFASSWLLKQFFLYSCYALIGPVHGNVILTIRGPLAIVITLILLKLHVQDLDSATGAKIWFRRSIATILMVAAILLYTLH